MQKGYDQVRVFKAIICIEPLTNYQYHDEIYGLDTNDGNSDSQAKEAHTDIMSQASSSFCQSDIWMSLKATRILASKYQLTMSVVSSSGPDLWLTIDQNQDMQKDYTFFGGAPDNVINAIKGKFNPSLGKPCQYCRNMAKAVTDVQSGALTPVMHDIVIQNREQTIGVFQGTIHY